MEEVTQPYRQQPYLVMGWDAKQVSVGVDDVHKEWKRRHDEVVAHEAAEDARIAAAEIARRNKREDDFLAPYQQYLANHPPRTGPIRLENLVGSYGVRCAEIESTWCGGYNEKHDMKMNIFPSESVHGLKASFDFSRIEGTMLMGFTQQSVELLVEEKPTKDSDGYSSEEDTDTKKPQRGSALSQPNHWSGLLEIAPDISAEGAVTRVYFKFRNGPGKDGEALPDEEDDQVGYLDFGSV